MKKIATLVLISVLLSISVMAQTKDVRTDEKHLKNTIKDKKEDKHEAGKDMAHLRVKKAVRGRKEVRRHRRSIHRQGEHLETHGVKHPIEKAKHEAKKDKDIKKGKD